MLGVAGLYFGALFGPLSFVILRTPIRDTCSRNADSFRRYMYLCMAACELVRHRSPDVFFMRYPAPDMAKGCHGNEFSLPRLPRGEVITQPTLLSPLYTAAPACLMLRVQVNCHDSLRQRATLSECGHPPRVRLASECVDPAPALPRSLRHPCGVETLLEPHLQPAGV